MNYYSSDNLNLFGYYDLFNDLKELYDKNALPNKIIFSGNKGIGKSTFAYHITNFIFSKNEKYKYDFSNNIISENNYSYNLIKKGTHPNFFLISNDEDKSNFQISKVREMINFTNKSSFNNLSKIILIDNVEQLSINSTNALLKVIEEPNNNIYFFLIHNNKIKILDTLKSRCIKYNLFLNDDDKFKIINASTNNNFYSSLNNDFKSIYSSPGDFISLFNFFNENNIEPNITIDDLLKFIIEKSLFKKNLYIKNYLSLLIELYFKKKINYTNSKDKIYNFYRHFLSKIYNSDKYNLDVESILIEFDRKLLNE